MMLLWFTTGLAKLMSSSICSREVAAPRTGFQSRTVSVTRPFSEGLVRSAARSPSIVYEMGWGERRVDAATEHGLDPCVVDVRRHQGRVDGRGRLGRRVGGDLGRVGEVLVRADLQVVLRGALDTGPADQRRAVRLDEDAGRAEHGRRGDDVALEGGGGPAGVTGAGDADPPPQVAGRQLDGRGVLAVDGIGVDQPRGEGVRGRHLDVVPRRVGEPLPLEVRSLRDGLPACRADDVRGSRTPGPEGCPLAQPDRDLKQAHHCAQQRTARRGERTTNTGGLPSRDGAARRSTLGRQVRAPRGNRGPYGPKGLCVMTDRPRPRARQERVYSRPREKAASRSWRE